MLRRFPRPACLIAAALLGTAWLGTACSAGSKTAARRPSVPPPGTSTTGPTAAPAACAGATASGAHGGGDVLVPGDIPDNQAYVAYQSTNDGYHLNVPEGWARTATTGTVTFSDRFNSIRVQVTPAPIAPSITSAQSIEVAALAAANPCFEPGQVSTVTRTAGTAVLITYRADSPADPVTAKVVRQDVERYEFWKADRLAVMTLSSPKGSDNVDPWKRVTDSFGWTT